MHEQKVNEFLRRSNELLETSKKDLKEVKTSLKTIHKSNPSLVDPELFVRLDRLADNIKVAKDAKAKVDALTVAVENHEKRLNELQAEIEQLKSTHPLSELNKKIGAKLLE